MNWLSSWSAKKLSKTRLPSANTEASVCLNLSIQGSDHGDLEVDHLPIKTARILGIAGIAGNGQNELLDVLSGEKYHANSTLKYWGEDISLWSIRQRNEAGILFVPTERLGRSAAVKMTLLDNTLLSISQLSRYVFSGLIRRSKTKRFTQQIVDEFKVKTNGIKSLAGRLSGGNLQKFIVGRAILQNPKVLIIANPTWGVDIDSATFIHNKLIELRDEGVAVLVCSENLDELLTISDEIAVINQGHLSEVMATKTVDRELIGSMMIA